MSEEVLFWLVRKMGEPILTVRWDIVGMLKNFLRQAALTAGLSGLIVMRWPLQLVEKGSHGSATACSLSMVILWN